MSADFSLEIFDTLSLPVVKFDKGGIITYLNSAAKATKIAECGADICDTFKSVMWGNVFARLTDGLPASLAADREGVGQFLTLLPVEDGKSYAGGICGISARAALPSDPGLAGFLHDLKNPLLTADSALTLYRDNRAGENAEKYFEIACRNVKSAISLLKNARRDLNLADPENYSMENVSICGLVCELYDDFCSSLPASQPLPEISLPRLAPNICCDSAKIMKVLYNLCGNAKMHGTGKIALALHAGADSVTIEVFSSGTPLCASDLPLLRTPFYSTSSAGGSGLGLYIASKIIAAHGGELFLHPQKDGNIFGFTLPLGGGDTVCSFAATYFVRIADEK